MKALPFLERLGLLVEQESLVRDQRKQDRLIRQARFKLRATVQGHRLPAPSQPATATDCPAGPGRLVATGHKTCSLPALAAVGKTYLACALGHNACLHGYTTRYYRLSRLLLAFTPGQG